MPNHRGSPTVRRRRLATILGQMREAKDLTPEQVVEELGWSPGKLRFIESGKWQRPNPRDVRDLLDVYEVTDGRQREYLLTLAKEGRQRGWWHAFKDQLSETYSTYVGLEAGAASVLNFEQVMIAGLLQTEDYARSLIKADAAEITAKEIDDRVQVRMTRQELLTQDDPMRLWAVMDEAALRRQVGGAATMRAQMRHLLEMAEHPRVTMQLIPFEAGAHAGVRGPFVILEFPDPDDIDAVYVDTVAGELFVEDLPEVRRFTDAFHSLRAVAASPEATIDLIARTANRP